VWDVLPFISDVTTTFTGLYHVNLYDLLPFIENNPFSPYITGDGGAGEGGQGYYQFFIRVVVSWSPLAIFLLLVLGSGYGAIKVVERREKKKKAKAKRRKQRRKGKRRKVTVIPRS
jgi:hypothetical protein